jgi:hypothetical protein
MDKLSETDKRGITVFAAYTSRIFWDQMNLEKRGQLREIYPEIMKSHASQEYLSCELSKVMKNEDLEYNLFKFRRNLSQLELECLKQ